MLHDRPISPHLQIYTLPITGIISITHRLTGVFLAVGLIGIVVMLLQIRNGMLSYLQMQSILQFLPIKLLVAGFIYALIFHLCHGIRHLIWDVGHSFSRDTLTRYALMEIFASLILTVITLVVLL
ncbi:MAG: succinate dehydrogenase, cytochrome b556 subunit [Methylococcales bacterium]|nr:succinate dehydrogenase, cytochrome b556 subunit [Methylococcales bacterium]MDD5753653.1 succinate dehydrogenase, cytochrome b556 subunit [Methylococcales bacterium]